MSNLMSQSARKSSQGRATNAEKYTRQIERVQADLAHARSVLAWQIEQGYEQQAGYTRKTVERLEARLAKLAE